MERLKDDSFSGDRLNKPGVWAVCFGADWCPFCTAFLKTFQRLDTAGDLRIAWGDVTDTDSPLWDSFSIEVIPTLVVFRDGEATWRRDGRAGRGLSDADVAAMKKALGL